ncbi:hypothetical protein [Flavobacterium sp.]|jgi:thymidylate kinase|uniref:hypothetical protein n=1 Tax=Flavobacterium sp. TaxID=239 RepID=UPI0022C5BF51|nr:hypothetical protein [Flavobacterium sp.]MCZ8229419.1 hypothetical protein [Flavobacterium sp.]
MKTILNLAGYDLSSKKTTVYEHSILLSYIANRDGSPRWIWNSDNNEPLFLKFYNVGSKSSWFFAKLIQLIFVLKLQGLLFKQKRWFYAVDKNPLFDLKSDWALFTGTVGPNNKAILYANKTFYKIACTENATQLIKNEYRILKEVQRVARGFTTPLIRKVNNNIIQLSDISENGKRVAKITDTHLQVLQEMAMLRKQTIEVKNWIWFQEIKADFLKIEDPRIPKNLIRKIESLSNSVTKQPVTLGFSQGDFTPWNQYQQDATIALYDWELARPDRPFAFDYFHFVIQQGIMVDRKKWTEIYKDLKEQCVDSQGNCLFNHDLNTFKNQLKWYLLTNCMHYLKVYAEQSEWHTQIEWLLTVWNEALNVFFEEEKSPRELVIMDVFDSIQNRDYGALKFPNYVPEKLSEASDIDLVIEKKEAKKMLLFLKSHHLVNRVSVEKKSFMYALQAVLTDGSILAIDLIWQLKVRNLEIMNAQEVYKNNPISPFGVRHVPSIVSARFTALFYLLNNAKVPSRYSHYLPLLEKSQNALDLHITSCINENGNEQSRLQQFIEKNPKNQSFYYLKNMVFYVLDTLKSFANTSGYIITFSGVDGAGKSTVIEQIAHRIQKQLRKPVVILRHRPSILPILSVWTKGKEKAQLDAISSLPRQGKNNNPISSLIRFSYYYLDYIIGQFVIYFKYIIRGYVVVYDRYYFDFINDSKRSNIVLPKKLTTFGYRFLMQPDYNFFLFADANVILKRKQELSKNTIEELTTDYKQLFDRLQNRGKSNVYQSINNVDLDVTLSKVFQTITMAH